MLFFSSATSSHSQNRELETSGEPVGPSAAAPCSSPAGLRIPKTRPISSCSASPQNVCKAAISNVRLKDLRRDPVQPHSCKFPALGLGRGWMQLKEVCSCLVFAELCPTALSFLVFYKIGILFWFCLLGDDSFLPEVPCSVCCNEEEPRLFHPG